jgi:hypothetical protein
MQKQFMILGNSENSWVKTWYEKNLHDNSTLFKVQKVDVEQACTLPCVPHFIF